MQHYPFDDGALAELSALFGQKTIKAICGKRVAFHPHMSHKPIECPACRMALRQRIDDSREMLKLSAAYISPETKAACTLELDRLAAILT